MKLSDDATTSEQLHLSRMGLPSDSFPNFLRQTYTLNDTIHVVHPELLIVVHTILMIILCMEIKYNPPNPKLTPININPRITPICVLNIALNSTKTRRVNFRTTFKYSLPFL